MTEDNGGAAFPTKGGMLFYFPQERKDDLEKIADEINRDHSGMSLRDYFAAAALTGLLASGDIKSVPTREVITHHAYKYADAMLSARKKETGE